MKLILALVSAMVLAGCATRPEFLENRVVCTAAKDEAHLVSKWGPIGIASAISEKDREMICK